MNRTFALALGILMTTVLSLTGMVLIPEWQSLPLRRSPTVQVGGEEVVYPEALETDLEVPGRLLYMGMGCIYCHSQQVRDPGFGKDVERGWGDRRSVPRDYLQQAPPLLGTMRTGPDLAHIAGRQPALTWHHLHLFDARTVSKGSIMPPFRFLYRVVETEAQPPGEAYALPKEYLGHAAWIVPERPAQQIVAYLLSLHQDHSLEAVQ